jgi:DNA-binding NarL/FixJ family response regulator
MVERAAARQHDVAIVARSASLDGLPELARRTDPDVLVVGLDSPELPAECVELLMERPRMRVLGIVAHEGTAWVYELRPEQIELGEVSPEDVVDLIRSAVQRPSPF